MHVLIRRIKEVDARYEGCGMKEGSTKSLLLQVERWINALASGHIFVAT